MTSPRTSWRAATLAKHPDEKPLLLLDGMSLAFRAFYALDVAIATSEGVVTNALHGFASMLATLIKTHEPRALVVAFDLPGGSFRDDIAVDYKGGRAATPPEIEHQFDLIRDLCSSLAIPVVGVPGFEADDVLATLATWGRDNHIPTIVVTGDRDSFQLVEDPFIRVLYNKRGVSDYDLYDEAGIIERCGVEPQRYPLYAALRGDPSDNLPGVPGVGEKTAAKLLQTYRDFDELFANTTAQTPKLRENLEASEHIARHNLEVMKLVRTVPIDVHPENFHLGGWSPTTVSSFFDRFEMNAMKQRFMRLISDGALGNPIDASSPTEQSVPVVETADLREGAALSDVVGHDDVIAWGSPSVVALARRGETTGWVGRWAEAAEGLATTGFCGHDLKALYRALASEGHVVPDPHHDTAIAAYLIDSSASSYDLSSVASQFGLPVLTATAPSLFDDTPDSAALMSELTTVATLIDRVENRIDEMELRRVYEEIELPLVGVLARMEALGIAVDRDVLTEITNTFADEVASLDERIQQVAGHPFKVNSPQQLQAVLFDELGLTPTKKIKSGYSTDASSLESIVDEHEIVPLILRFREIDKLRSTYGTSLISTVAEDGRIHASFNQMVARTGRLSSESPNLHNIPVRSEEGRRLRTAFVPRPGWDLLVSDYNQIELRILAHLSQDPGLLQAFSAGSDVHSSIASTVFGVPVERVSKEQRERAKAVSYGLAYGMEAFGLSQRLGVSVSEAKGVMDQYFDGFPALKTYTEKTIADVRQRGFSRTEFGRIRHFPDLMTASGPQRAAAERQAVNAGIQGLAADIFKLALVRLDRGLRGAGLEARIVLQVHDEVIVEAPPAERAAVEHEVTTALEGAATLSVPLAISLAWGANWAEAKA